MQFDVKLATSLGTINMLLSEPMLYLRMYRAELSSGQFARLDELRRILGETLRPLLLPTLQAPAEILGVSAESLRPSVTSGQDTLLRAATTVVDGEVYTDGESLIAISVYAPTSRLLRSGGRTVLRPTNEVVYRLEVIAVGPRWECSSVAPVLSSIERVLEVTPLPYFYPSQQFEELKAEGRETPAPLAPDELRGSDILGNKPIRTLAVAIKASGGLLVKDASKQLAADSRDSVDNFIAELKSARIVDSEIVVVCSKTQAQVTRAKDRELINELSLKGLKCACGVPMIDERIEEALTITELGRALLDKSRWLTVLVIRELEAVGVSREAMLVEQTVGGDEIDCLANVSGELVLFELKDKEFNLGNAYSFGAKIGIIQPKVPVIVTTEYVGKDAKEHFVRARVSSGDKTAEIAYVEGVENLKNGIENIVSAIYRADGSRLLDKILKLATLDGASFINSIEQGAESHTQAIAGGAA